MFSVGQIVCEKKLKKKIKREREKYGTSLAGIKINAAKYEILSGIHDMFLERVFLVKHCSN